MMPGGVSRKDADGLLKIIELAAKDPGLKKAVKALIAADDESRQTIAAAAEINTQIAADRKALETAQGALDARKTGLDNAASEQASASEALRKREDALQQTKTGLASDRREHAADKKQAEREAGTREIALDMRESDLNDRAEALDKRHDRISEREDAANAARDREADKQRRIEEIRAG